MNHLILGDNLEVLKTLEAESIDLIYLDPPFFSNRNYEVIWGDEGEIRSFKDRWAGGIDHYIVWLKERVEEMYRLLKPTGSFYLHCDHHANAYIRVFILDRIFGEKNFRSEITWKRTVPKGNSKTLPNNSDTIFWYSKHAKKFTYNPIFLPLQGKHYSRKDLDGRVWQDTALNAPGKGYRYEWNGIIKNWRCSLEKMREYQNKDLLYYTSKGTPRLKRYLDNSKGRSLDNCWIDIPPVNSQAKERIGYPTQKPEALLERIIKASSNENDVVLDPFMGGGTTIAVADKLKRNWIGIDQSVQAVKVTELRLQKQKDLYSQPFTVQLHKYDYEILRYQNAFQFETWIIEQFGGQPNLKQRSDFGIDGQKNKIPIQVKRSDNVGRNVVDNFTAAIRRFDKSRFEKSKREQTTAGYIIAFSFGKGAVQEVARLKNEEQVILDLTLVSDIVPLAEKPKVKLELEDLGLDAKELRTLAFEASSESEIAFYAWDWAYEVEKGFRPAVVLDKVGKQKHKFGSGSHKIGVKVVDLEGLESIEVLEVKVNGVLEV